MSFTVLHVFMSSIKLLVFLSSSWFGWLPLKQHHQFTVLGVREEVHWSSTHRSERGSLGLVRLLPAQTAQHKWK